uniref:VWA domain-containing protein n=1 Tax=Ascaris lumbricoides TaxID=6252 RepID=A0A0M3I882_ASCLU
MRPSALGALLQALLVGLLWASSPERAPPGTSSLTFVFDTTGSMNDDLIQVQDGARKILDTVLTQREKLIYNYVYVPFHDPRKSSICGVFPIRAPS